MKQESALINEKSTWKELTIAGMIVGGGTSKEFNTGDWRTDRPEWLLDKCKQCLLCTPVCPDSSIPVLQSKRQDFDFDHCKGCGICARCCPFAAIIMKRDEGNGN